VKIALLTHENEIFLTKNERCDFLFLYVLKYFLYLIINWLDFFCDIFLHVKTISHQKKSTFLSNFSIPYIHNQLPF